MLHIKDYRITKNKYELKTEQGTDYTIDISLPMIECDDNSMVIFPGAQIYALFMSDKTFMPEPNYIDDEILGDNVESDEEVNPDNKVEGKGIVKIQKIGLDVVSDGEEEAQLIYLFRMYYE